MSNNLFGSDDEFVNVDHNLESSLMCEYPNILRVTINNETLRTVNEAIAYAKAVHDKLKAHGIEPKAPVSFKILSVNFYAGFMQALSVTPNLDGGDDEVVEENTENPVLIVDVDGDFKFSVVWGDMNDILETKSFETIFDLCGPLTFIDGHPLNLHRRSSASG